MGNKLSSFASLKWYDAFIEFLFKLAAKTSEPLLAVGVVYSAADVLSHGHLGYGNIAVQNAWAMTQALAIESSGGVVLVYGLQSLREKDHIKAWLYLALSALLGLVGTVMLYMQMTGMEATQGNSPFMLGLFALRCVVSVGYIYLMRSKHIRFTDLAQAESVTPGNTLARGDMDAVLAALAEVKSLRTQVTQLQQQAALPPAHAQPMLPEPEKPERGDTQSEQGIHTTSELPVITPLVEPERGETNEQSYGARIEALYKDNPQITIPEIEEAVGCSRSTAQKWLKRLKPQAEEA